MTPSLGKALLDPQLWRLEAARRRRQLEELQGYLHRLEVQCATLEQQVQGFAARYEAHLGEAWTRVESLQAQLLRALELLARRSGADLPPAPPRRRQHVLPTLPLSAPWPTAPADEAAAIAPSLKDLHRRAAMRLHPDRAQEATERARRESLMRDANLAYAQADRATLEALLIAAGESPQRLGGFDVHAHWVWLEHCEALAQTRLRQLRTHLARLREHPHSQLADAIERAQAKGLNPLAVMAVRLEAQAHDLQQQLYIGTRLQPGSELALSFLKRWNARWAEPDAPAS